MEEATIDDAAEINIKANQRVLDIRERFKGITPALCVERDRLLTESYKETEGESSFIRRAKALGKILREMKISIE